MNTTRATLGLLIATILIAGFGFLFLQAGTPEAQASGADANRLAWLGGCYPPALAVGRYFPGDAPCRPSQTISLSEIEFSMKTHGVMRLRENLEFAPQPRARNLTCWGLILDGAKAAGWLCSDDLGVYRTALDGPPASAHWQLDSDGLWTQQ